MVLYKLKADISSQIPKEKHKQYKIQKSEFKIKLILSRRKKLLENILQLCYRDESYKKQCS